MESFIVKERIIVQTKKFRFIKKKLFKKKRAMQRKSYKPANRLYPHGNFISLLSFCDEGFGARYPDNRLNF